MGRHVVYVSGCVGQRRLDIRHLKTFCPITFITATAIGTEPSLSTGYKEELGAGEAEALPYDSLIRCQGWDSAELGLHTVRYHNGVMCVEKNTVLASPARDIIYAVWKASLNIGT